MSMIEVTNTRTTAQTDLTTAVTVVNDATSTATQITNALATAGQSLGAQGIAVTQARVDSANDALLDADFYADHSLYPAALLTTLDNVLTNGPTPAV